MTERYFILRMDHRRRRRWTRRTRKGAIQCAWTADQRAITVNADTLVFDGVENECILRIENGKEVPTDCSEKRIAWLAAEWRLANVCRAFAA